MRSSSARHRTGKSPSRSASAKWRLNRPYDEFIDIALYQYGFQLLPIQPAHTARLIGLPFPQRHRDPFDRLLVAQVLVEQIPIVSADSPLDAYGVTRLW